MVKYRIAHFLAHYPQPGGSTHVVHGLSRALVRLGYQVIIYTYQQRPDVEGEEVKSFSGLRVEHFRGSNWNPFHMPGEMRARLLQNKDMIDLLIVHGAWNPGNVCVAKAARDAGIPYVVWLHGVYGRKLFQRFRIRKLAYERVFDRPLLRRASGIHVFPQQNTRTFAECGVRVPTFAGPNGFDPEEVPELHQAGGVSESGDGTKLNFLFLGRIEVRPKGLDLLFKALSAGIDDGKLPTNLRLNLVGPDWGGQRGLETLAAQLRITQFVKFRGRVSSAERWAVLSSHDILVLPSRWEGFPMVVIEAMVVGKPVIVSEEAGVSSFVRQAQCGYLVQPNPASICAGLVRAIETRDQWRRMGESGRKFAYEHFTWDKIAAQEARSLEEVLGRAKATVESPSSK
jgi:glycosyltransferase involved in cell wall biosynthesis